MAGFLFLLVAVLSFTRAVQRLFEQTWELAPLSVRNSVNGLVWTGGLDALHRAQRAASHAGSAATALDLVASLLVTPFSAVFFVWTGLVLSARADPELAQLVPFARPGRGADLGIYSVGARVYRAAVLQRLRDALRRDRRGLRDDLGAVLRHGGPRRLRRRRA